MGCWRGSLAECWSAPYACLVPLEVPLELVRSPAGGSLRCEGTVVVEAVPTAISVTAPPPVDFQAAAHAMASSPAMDPRHPFPTCFVCAPRRGIHDGLRIFPASGDGGVHLASWVPDPEFGDSESNSEAFLRPEILWAALDCPTGFAAGFPTAGKLVTGRLAVQQLKPIRTGAGCVLISWPLEVEGRKHFSAACLYQNAMLCAVARATWIKIG